MREKREELVTPGNAMPSTTAVKNEYGAEIGKKALEELDAFRSQIEREEEEKLERKNEPTKKCKAEIAPWILFTCRCCKRNYGCGKDFSANYQSVIKFCECIDGDKIDSVCFECEEEVSVAAGRMNFFIPSFVLIVVMACIFIPLTLIELKKLMFDVEKIREEQRLLDMYYEKYDG